MKAELLHEKRVISSQHDEPNHKKHLKQSSLPHFTSSKRSPSSSSADCFNCCQSSVDHTVSIPRHLARQRSLVTLAPTWPRWNWLFLAICCPCFWAFPFLRETRLVNAVLSAVMLKLPAWRHTAHQQRRGLNLRPAAYKAEPLSTEEWLQCRKWAEFGTDHTARRLVKGKEKLKRVSCTQKNGLELVHPERVRPGEAQNGGLGEKNVSQRKTVFKACGALKKAQGQDLALEPLKQAFFSIEITSFLGPENFRIFRALCLRLRPDESKALAWNESHLFPNLPQ